MELPWGRVSWLLSRGWAKQKNESSGHFRNLLNCLFWHYSSIVQLVLSCRNFSLNKFWRLLCFGRVHIRRSCIIWNKCTEKRKSIPALPEFFANINSLNSEIGMSITRNRIQIFYIWFLFLFHEIVAESKINLWMDIRVIGIGGRLKPDILIEHGQSMVSLKVTIMIEMDWEQTNVEWLKLLFRYDSIS